ncbi:MAG: cob(I)yrinic acid a,c-diamide adenosyltransferase [Candidatus Omnitrophota bacterium]
MLVVKDLICGYDLGKPVLRNISLRIAQGEIAGIIGPNGSGKTTLLKAMSRALKPESGEILFNGKNIWWMAIKELSRQIAVVSQNSPSNFMTVEEFVLLGRIPYFEGFRFFETKHDLETARECMNLTDSFRFKDRFLHELSGGECQLVVIARALAQKPKLLLLDEPTSHLDITHQVKILDLIRRLNNKLGITVIMVLHDLNLASEYCRRLILMNEGTIQKQGIPEDVLKYDIIEDSYKTVVVVKKSPVSSKPYVFMVPGGIHQTLYRDIMKKTGLIQIYTGDGKGKTTAAVGLACRARGQGFRVCYISFCKTGHNGETDILKQIGVDVFGFGKKGSCLHKNVNKDEVGKDCLKALKLVEELYKQYRYDLMILDEINVCIGKGFLKENEVLEIMRRKPEEMELVLTGRGCPKKIIEKADLASEVRKIKHPYDMGIKKREGIEF